MTAQTPTPTNFDRSPTAIDRETLLVAGVALLGTFMALLDSTIVFVALNPLAGRFEVTFTTIQWVITAYTLALAATFPIAGWASDRFGVKRVYVTGLAVFVAGSALCALAWSAESLIACRVLQGIGGGLILPAGRTVVTRKAGPHRRGRVMGILGVPLVLAPLLGPILGGWLVDEVSWQWIFLINVPIGAAAVALAAGILEREEPQPAEPLDWLGMALLPPGLTLVLFGLAGSADGGAEAAAWVPILLGAALIAAFTVHAWRAEAPLIDVRRFVRTRAGAAAATLLIAAIALFGTLLLMPLYYQSVRGASALESGLLLAPWGLGVMVMLPLAGWLTDRWGPRRLPLIGVLMIALGLAPFAAIASNTSPALLCASSFVLGLGDALVFIPASTAVMTMVPRSALARISTALSIITESAASIGTAIVSVLLASSVAGQLLAGAHHGGAFGAGSGERSGAVADRLAAAFASSFGWMIALLLVALVPALALAVGSWRSAPQHEEDEIAFERA